MKVLTNCCLVGTREEGENVSFVIGQEGDAFAVW